LDRDGHRHDLGPRRCLGAIRSVARARARLHVRTARQRSSGLAQTLTRFLQVTARMRVALITILIAGCGGEPKLVMKPLPPLMEPQARVPSREIVVGDIGLDPGEHWIWDVQVKGFSIG